MRISPGAADAFDAPLSIERQPATAEGGCHATAARQLRGNPLRTFAELIGALPALVAEGDWLDAFLIAAGANQIVEDFLHLDPLQGSRAAKYIRGLYPPFGKLAASVIGTTCVAAERRRSTRLVRAGLGAYQTQLGRLVELLAAEAVLLESSRGSNSKAAYLTLSLARLVEQQSRSLPTALQRDIVRLPSCFQSFDLCPNDVAQLVQSFAHRLPERQTHTIVVGVRTSGSYMAPLAAAWLRNLGYQRVASLTYRPGRPLLRHERHVLEATARADTVLLIDDPPASGASVADTAAELERVGCLRSSIVLLLPLFGPSDSLPVRLAHYQCVLLPWSNWGIHQKLKPANIQADLDRLLAGTRVLEVSSLPMPARSHTATRGHLTARCRVTLRTADQDEYQIEVHAQGAGIGYFADYARAVADAISNRIPQTFGLTDGIFYRMWLPGEDRLDAHAPNLEAAARHVIAYVIARRNELPVSEDMSLRMAGRGPAWERAAETVSRGFGKPGLLLRPLIGLWTKQLLRPSQPALIDGNPSIDRWFVAHDGDDRLLKVDFFDGAFSNRDHTCYDIVFDLAGVAASTRDSALPSLLKLEYQTATGEHIAAEKWLLYQWTHLGRALLASPHKAANIQSAMGRLLQQYLARRYLHDVRDSASGPLCALDIDGVLETDQLGFSIAPPAAVRTLRALRQHGYRVVLASGRSLDEVQERCRTWGLVGGTGEYGAGIYAAAGARTEHLITPTQRECLERLRSHLAGLPGVRLDARYHDCIRAYMWDEAILRRRSLPPQISNTAISALGLGSEIRAVQGKSQTDFVPVGVDKGAGLSALLDMLRIPARAESKPLKLAVGDSLSDSPMLALAERAYAPAQGDPRLRSEGVRMTSAPGALGLAQAASRLLGHPPGACSICRPPLLSADAQLLLIALAGLDGGRASKVWRALELTGRILWRTAFADTKLTPPE
jgi:trehalose-6-phosphatase